MCPVLFHLFGIPVRAYGLLIMLGAVVAYVIARKRAPARGIDPHKLDGALYWAVFPGILGARLAFVVQEWPYYSKHLDEIVKLRLDGLTSFGGLLFGFFGLVLWAKLANYRLVSVLDMVGVPVLVAQAIGRVGCLLNGCCYGGPTTSWIGVRFLEGPDLHPMTVPHQPAQIYESAMLLAGAAVVLLFERKGLHRGVSLGLSLIVLGVSRFIYEIWRAGTTSTTIGSLPITDAQVVAAAIAFLGAGIALVAARRATPAREAREA